MPHSLEGAQCLLLQREALSSSPQKRERIAQTPRATRRKEGQVPLASHREPALQYVDGAADISLDYMEIGETPTRYGQAIGVFRRLSETDSFLAVDHPLLELTLVGIKSSQIRTGDYRRRSDEGNSFQAWLSNKQLQDSQKKRLGLSIIQRREAGRSEKEIRRHLERNIPKGIGKSPGGLAKPASFYRIST